MSLTSTQLAILKTELQNDPLALGYSAFLTKGDDTSVANLVNTIGPVTDGRYLVPNEPVSASAILAQITTTDLQAMTTTQNQNLSLYLTAQTIDLSTKGGNNLSNVLSCLPNPGTSRTAIQALSVRPGTRGEVIFQTNGIRITANDVSNAMAS